MFEDEFEEFRARSYSGGVLPIDSRQRALFRCHGQRRRRQLTDHDTDYDRHPSRQYSPSPGTPRHRLHGGSLKESPRCYRPRVKSPACQLPRTPSDYDVNLPTGYRQPHQHHHRCLISQVIERLEALTCSASRCTSSSSGSIVGNSGGGGVHNLPIVASSHSDVSFSRGLDLEWNLGESRPRVSSMPTRGLRPRRRAPPLDNAWSKRHTSLYRVRSFAIDSKGQVDRGPIYVSRQSSSNASSSAAVSPAHSRQNSEDLPVINAIDQPAYRVAVAGALAVGKSSIVNSFIAIEATSSTSTGQSRYR